jgi:hypothetical protein
LGQQTFDIEIPNERLKTYKLITFIILSINFFGFGFVFLKTSGTISYLAILLIIINAVPWSFYLLNKRHLKYPLIDFAFVASACLWFYIANSWMAIFLLLFVVFGYFANKVPIIHFTTEGIEYPSFPTKKYLWADVQNVIWKDDMLTIDLKNNTLLQCNIDKDVAGKIDVANFNNWCANFIKQEN